MDSKKIFEKINTICKNKKITIKELEKNLKIANGTIGKWGKGKSTPKTNTLNKIADYLNVTLDYLITEKIDEKETEIIAFYRKADERGKDRIYRTAKDEADQAEQLLHQKENITEFSKEIKPFA